MITKTIQPPEVVEAPEGNTNPKGKSFHAWALRFLVVLGGITLLYYFSWWFTEGVRLSPWMWLGLVAAVVSATPQLFGNWILYLKAREWHTGSTAPDHLTVDVFVTVYNEPHAMIQKTLAAACNMRGEHRTWLLDDSRDPALAVMARQYGANYLSRRDHKDAKAGNINAALRRTNADIIAIFDVDHVPDPAFLERTVGHFNNPRVGFVQVMLTFNNGKNSWTARAATESSLDYYNPTSKGADGLGSATLTGSNALIRRTALESIHGYKPGLAEDLATSIALHAAGWHSVYVAEPLAPGLAPPDLAAWFTQQFKWSRGVFELLLTDYFHYFKQLSWGQRISYSVRMTYYWVGPVAAAHLIFTAAVLLSGSATAYAALQSYLVHLIPIAVTALAIRQIALINWRHPSISNGLLWRPVSLIYATWPIYTVAWIMAILRVPLGFRPTPKDPASGVNPVWLIPQVIALLLLLVGGAYAYSNFESMPLLMFLFIAGQCVLQMVIFWQWPRARSANNISAGTRTVP